MLVIFYVTAISKIVDGVFRCGVDFNGDMCPDSMCCSLWGYCGVTEDYCSSSLGCQSNCERSNVSIVPSGRCGSLFGGAVCQDGSCCSQWGWCGVTPDHCEISLGCESNCQLESSVNDIRQCNTPNTIALTFDDGPNENTLILLDLLRSYNMKATFFVIGSLAQQRPEIIQRMLSEGHDVENHTWNHEDVLTQSEDIFLQSLRSTSNSLTNPKYWRAPYGSYNDIYVDNAYRTLNLRHVYWSHDTRDWELRLNARSRDIVNLYDTWLNGQPLLTLQHDIHSETVQVFGDVLELIRTRNYRTIKLDEC